MPELHKIETAANFLPEIGSIVVFIALEDGRPVLMAKKSNGETVKLSDGLEVTLGYVNANHQFQPVSFSGTDASASEDPETVDTFYTWDSPVQNIQDISSSELYAELSEI